MSDASILFPQLTQAEPKTAKPAAPAPPAAKQAKDPEEKEERPFTELDMLKQRANLMGIKYPADVKVEVLDAMIGAVLQKEKEVPKTVEATPASAAPVTAEAPAPHRATTMQELRRQLMDENLQLIRVRITCLDPKKADLKGEILTVANRFIGKVSKFVPYGDACGEDGYHIPRALFLMMRERKFTQVKTDPKTNYPTSRDVPEYAIEVLPPLTGSQLKRLALKQAAAKGAVEAD